MTQVLPPSPEMLWDKLRIAVYAGRRAFRRHLKACYWRPPVLPRLPGGEDGGRFEAT
ncbi:MAG: hypothetical protein ACK4YQ_10210 [Phenylobacterium sp.]|uniref:hypothetical protein n=1 Tax=Phenylobacterium sp. TaxID=1871053 RepID=UPI00391B1A5C